MGGASLAGIAAVVGDEGVETRDWGLESGDERLEIRDSSRAISDLQSPSSVLDGIAALVDQNLVVRLPGVDDEPRFGMLETVREYALERLAESGEEAAMRQRHAEYFRALAEDSESEWEGPEEPAWLARLQAELDNLRAALAWSVAAPGRAETGLRLLGASGWFWFNSGYLSEGRAWLTAVLDLPEAAPRTALRAKVLRQLGRLVVWQADYAEARVVLEESAVICRELGDRRGLGEALALLGNALDGYDAAQPIWEESVAALREANAPHTLALALRWLALSHMTRRDFKAARAGLEESLQLVQQLQNSLGIGIAMTGLGQLAEAEGDYAAARRWYEQALVYREQAGEKYGVAHVLVMAARMALLQGDYLVATAYAERGLPICREVGNRNGLMGAHQILGHVACGQGETAAAMAHFRQSLTLPQARVAGAPSVRGMLGVARVWHATGQSVRAARLLGAAARSLAGLAFVQWPHDRASLDELVTTVRASLGEDEFAAAWAAGQAMPLDEAVTYALAAIPTAELRDG